MVRLEAWVLCAYAEDISISIPVWCDWKLRRTIQKIHRKTFQFQYGAIGSKFNCLFILLSFNFNSSMVRLEVLMLSTINFQKHNFNSSMVRLEVKKENKLNPLLPYFNSSMVRLEESILCGLWLLRIFQFQYGAIGSVNRALWNKQKSISIPVWCDWKSIPPTLNNLKTLFQFQYGAIGSPAGGTALRRPPAFQFQYGAIGRWPCP